MQKRHQEGAFGVNNISHLLTVHEANVVKQGHGRKLMKLVTAQKQKLHLIVIPTVMKKTIS